MQISTTVYCNTANLVTLRAFLQKHLHSLLVPEDQIYLMVLAMDEVCSNLIIHTHQCDPTKSFNITLKSDPISNHKVVFEIEDGGPYFNLHEHTSASMTQVVDNKQRGGMGLILVREIMDEVVIEQSNCTNIYRMSKQITRSQATV